MKPPKPAPKAPQAPLFTARLQSEDANNLETLALYLDVQDAKIGNTNNEVQRDLRRIAAYLRETFPNTINQPNQVPCSK